jgi:hypothetical protein
VKFAVDRHENAMKISNNATKMNTTKHEIMNVCAWHMHDEMQLTIITATATTATATYLAKEIGINPIFRAAVLTKSTLTFECKLIAASVLFCVIEVEGHGSPAECCSGGGSAGAVISDGIVCDCDERISLDSLDSDAD